ncbi:DUF5994 family protein [Nocardia miyunensis]|uniref:DUF5994 family protein n=1 Tax=Nocardia miyunensis TaxID=282684 RepID=UPI00082AD682|nr:DUF5994 family protein [Nocardia miyunensis]
MTLQTTRTGTDRYATSADRPRLRIAHEKRHSAVVDGAWWPQGGDLVTELTELLPVLIARLGPIHRVIYHLDEWAAAPGKATIGDRRISLDGYRHMPTGTVEIRPLDGAPLTLLVVPPGTGAESADALMSAAADPGKTATVVDLLAGLTSAAAERGGAEIGGAEQRWESEGGSGGY